MLHLGVQLEVGNQMQWFTLQRTHVVILKNSWGTHGIHYINYLTFTVRTVQYQW